MGTAATTEPVVGKSVKELVGTIARLLPDDATWDDVQYHISICQSIGAGLADAAAGRVVSGEEVMRRLRL